MASERIRVGIIGASPDRGWATRAHIPALRTLPGLELTAVGTSRIESAREAARIFGAAHAFADPRELAEHPDVDLVVITVKVPAHDELVRAALGAGKHVYSEWPLGLNTDEAVELARLAHATGVHHAVGLQSRHDPAIWRARELVAEGYVGQVISATVYSALTKRAGGRLPAWGAYTLDRRNGAGVLEVVGGHTLDAVEYVLGDIAELSAELAIRVPRSVVQETGETLDNTSPDHIRVNATVSGGAVISAHIHDAKVTDGRTRIEIAGTDGDLAIVSDVHGGAGIQMCGLRLLGSRGVGGEWRELVAGDAATVLEAESGNVGRLYARLEDDIRTGARTVADFDTAVHVHALLDAIRRSAETGTRMRPGATTAAVSRS
ncbi:Gfo/Idh/MocA family protein [Nocardia terpenica]|uniref:Gfo/Idh/MocA family oxidoreductase n=1 Tax=Nocardia terpenica TaxID=455432 RepID=A0A6G9ZCK3_9NOCA|nr:Gfo/Idh/MocA family oxidoreductase [Nocardia terpenica]QIS23268.1 gfo/Idh/MocA family oxidoreductase [Nocardia terpenica]